MEMSPTKLANITRRHTLKGSSGLNIFERPGGSLRIRPGRREAWPIDGTGRRLRARLLDISPQDPA
jgi:hypothetical protein